jgi:hypothetical protein
MYHLTRWLSIYFIPTLFFGPFILYLHSLALTRLMVLLIKHVLYFMIASGNCNQPIFQHPVSSNVDTHNIYTKGLYWTSSHEDKKIITCSTTALKKLASDMFDMGAYCHNVPPHRTSATEAKTMHAWKGKKFSSYRRKYRLIVAAMTTNY